MGAGPHRDSYPTDDGRNVMRMRPPHLEGDDPALALGAAEDAKRIHGSEAFMRVVGQVGHPHLELALLATGPQGGALFQTEGGLGVVIFGGGILSFSIFRPETFRVRAVFVSRNFPEA